MTVSSQPGTESSAPLARSPVEAVHFLSEASALPRWQFIVLGEIANFDALRRHLGAARAGELAQDVAARIVSLFPAIRAARCGQRLVELRLEGDRQADLETCVAQVRKACAVAFDLDGELHVLEFAFGAAAAAIGNVDEVRMIEEAEAAVREARAAPAHAVTHDLTIADPSVSRRIATELDAAIDRNELLLQYQPKVHVRRQEVSSAEALVRWRHPERGMILPSDFIPVAEQTGLIGRLTIWTIRQAIADQRLLIARGHDLRLFINISGQLLADIGFVREACDLVVASGARLGFEITETSVIRDPECAIRNLQTFADIGIVISIDDYGAGLSSLAYLKQLPARELKIDKLFVTKLTSSNRDPLIVRSTIDLAHALEMEVVAEGVENHAALALLTVMGCDMVQGYLISRPVAVTALITFLEEDREAAPADFRAPLQKFAAGRAGR